jgi:hypothetical protein
MATVAAKANDVAVSEVAVSSGERARVIFAPTLGTASGMTFISTSFWRSAAFSFGDGKNSFAHAGEPFD